MLRIVIFLILVLPYTKSFAAPFDSLRCERKGKKILVIHKIDEGQTLYSILKRYNSTKLEFQKANPSIDVDGKLVWQQIVKVPYHKPAPKVSEVVSKPLELPKNGRLDNDGIEVVDIPEATPKDTQLVQNTPKVEIIESKSNVKKAIDSKATNPNQTNVHSVVAGENLFVIAKKYNLKTWQLRLWNNLNSDFLKIGQKLIIEKPTNFVASNAKLPIKKDTLKPKIVQGPAGDVSKKVTKVPTKPSQPVPNAPGGRKLTEQGIVEMIEGGEQTTKYLAFHKTAPIGTLIIIKNDANNQSVWVKVIGKLSGSSDAIVRISSKAYEKLQTKDRRIRATINYTIK